MNFKRNLLSIITLVGSVFLVAGCKDRKAFRQYEFLDPQSDLKQEIDDHVDKDYGNYVKYGDFASYRAKDKDDEYVELGSTYEVLNKHGGMDILKSEGDRKILVIPVEFSDFTINDLGVEKEEYLSNLKKSFFGVSTNNKFLSVSEYYNRSSYGKLRLSGSVCESFYTFPYTAQSIITNDLSDDIVHSSYERILSWFQSSYPDFDLSEYRIDPEKETSRVAIYCVYTYPTELKQNPKVFWNYTFLDRPFSWSSYSCLNTLSGLPDSHTLIHEVGHLFGLPDYYPSNESDVDPSGRIDMMDCSVGDHSALSKMMFNWARPYYVKDSCEITIRAFANYGDLILVSDRWNNPSLKKANQTVFDEYYLIELYSPIGVNYFDASIGNNKAKLPLLPGIKIHHVDARIAYFSARPKTFLHYCDDEPGTINPSSSNVGLAHTNAQTYTIEDQPTYNLYELMLNGGKTLADQCATDENLFHRGDSFTINPDMFNARNSTNYKLTVTSLDYAKATIKFEKIITE